jgi:succinoglycan biosynthesis protein ExoM
LPILPWRVSKPLGGKTIGVTLASANSIFRRATTLIEPDPFDIAFGKSGGEDYDLFCRLQRRGCRLGWLPAARVRDFVPTSRCDGAYLRRRFFAGGQTYAAAVAGASRYPTAMRWWLRVKAALQFVALAVLAPIHARRGRDALIDYSCRLAGVLGKLSLGGYYSLYQKTDAGKRSKSLF